MTTSSVVSETFLPAAKSLLISLGQPTTYREVVTAKDLSTAGSTVSSTTHTVNAYIAEQAGSADGQFIRSGGFYAYLPGDAPFVPSDDDEIDHDGKPLAVESGSVRAIPNRESVAIWYLELKK